MLPKDLKVTILIPSYNGAKFIGQAVESALSQEYANLEVIVTDDNSPDNTEEICQKYTSDPRFTYHKNPKNLGRVANYRNGLFNLAHGDFVLNLDGDDYLTDTQFISDAVSLIENNNLSLVFARQQVLFESDGRLVTDKINSDLPELMDGSWFFLNFPKGYQMPHLASLYSRQEAIKRDFYSHDLLSSDMESLLKMLPNNKVGFINRTVGVWRKHKVNSSRTVTTQELITNGKYINNVFDFVSETKLIPVALLKKWHEQMIVRYFGKNILRSLISKKRSANTLLSDIKLYSPEDYNIITSDNKTKLLLLLGHSKLLLSFVVKHILKMESIFKDFGEL